MGKVVTRAGVSRQTVYNELGSKPELGQAMVLREVMLRHRWNKTRAAQELGLSRVGLRAKLQRFGLEDRAGDKVAAEPEAEEKAE